MKELSIELICAHSPQAKGRVERANQTLQDRLVKELRLRSISSLAEANAYLPEFITDFNSRFAVAPRSGEDAHRPLAADEDLDRILVLVERRTLSKNLTISYNNVIYQISTKRAAYTMRGAHVEVRETSGGEISIEYKGGDLPQRLPGAGAAAGARPAGEAARRRAPAAQTRARPRAGVTPVAALRLLGQVNAGDGKKR